MIDFELQNLRSYSTQCPRCGPTRKKSGQKSLMVHRDEDHVIRFKCYHSEGCEYSKWTQVRDTDSEKNHSLINNKIVESEVVLPIPSEIEVPNEWSGADKIHWYRDSQGNYLYAVLRHVKGDGSKVFTPLILTKTGEWKGGAGVKYPQATRIYGLDRLKDASKVLIVEGEKAADAGQAKLGDKGYAVITWRGGAGAVDQADFSMLRSFKEVVIWPDNDAVGIQAAEKLAAKLPVNTVRILHVDHLKEKSDIADVQTAADVTTAFKKARVVTNNYCGPMSVGDILAQINRRGDSVKTGFDVLDSRVQLPSSGVIVVEGRTGHGKTLLAVALATKWLKMGKRVSILSYEEPADRLIIRFVKSLNPDVVPESAHLSQEFEFFAKCIDDGLLELYDQETQISAEHLINSFNHESYKDSLVIVDNAQIVPFKSTYNSARHVQIKEQLMDPLRILSNRVGFLSVVLSQVTPNEMKPESDAPRDCKDIHMSAECVFRVWNKDDFAEHPFLNFVKGNFAIQVKKNRNGESNIVFDCVARVGAYLDIKSVLDAKTIQAYLRKARQDRYKKENLNNDFEESDAF